MAAERPGFGGLGAGSAAATSPFSNRRYICFKNATKTLHQTVGNCLTVRQWQFESARVLDCINGTSQAQKLGPGWVCATVSYSSSPSVSSGNFVGHGSISVDVVADEESGTNQSTYYAGNIMCSSKILSVAAETVTGTVLLTISADGGSVNYTKIEHSHAAGTATGNVPAATTNRSASNCTDANEVEIISTQSSASVASTGNALNAAIASISDPPPVSERRKERSHDEDRAISKSSSSSSSKKFDLNGTSHGSRERSAGASVSGSGSSTSTGSSGSGKQKERRRVEGECSPRGGTEPKRQKVAHHGSDRGVDTEGVRSNSHHHSTGSIAEGNAPTEFSAVAFLNHYASSSVLGPDGNEGALPSHPLPSPMVIETPGFTDYIDFDCTRGDSLHAVSTQGADILNCTRSASVSVESEGQTQVCTDREQRDILNDLMDFLGEGGSGSAPSTSQTSAKRLSNCGIPPNPQIDERSHQNYDAVFQSLMRLLNECKDKSTVIPAQEDLLGRVAGHTEETQTGTGINNPDPGDIYGSDSVSSNVTTAAIEAAIASAASRLLMAPPTPKPVQKPEIPAILRPICEIRPIIDVNRLPVTDPIQDNPTPSTSTGSDTVPVLSRGPGRPRRGAGSRGGRGSRGRRQPRRPDGRFGEIEETNSTRGGTRGRRSRRINPADRGPTRAEAARRNAVPIETIIVPDLSPEEETAIALQGLESVDFDIFN